MQESSSVSKGIFLSCLLIAATVCLYNPSLSILPLPVCPACSSHSRLHLDCSLDFRTTFDCGYTLLSQTFFQTRRVWRRSRKLDIITSPTVRPGQRKPRNPPPHAFKDPQSCPASHSTHHTTSTLSSMHARGIGVLEGCNEGTLKGRDGPPVIPDPDAETIHC